MQRLAQRRGGYLINRTLLCTVADFDKARLDPQPCAMAGRAFFFIDELGQLFLDRHRVCFAIAALQIVHHAFKRMFLHHRAAALVDVCKRNLVATRTIEHDLLRLFRQLFKGHIIVEAVVLSQRSQHLEVKLVAPVPALDCAGCK